MNVVHLSPDWEDFTGVSVADSLGQGWLSAVHPGDRALVEHALHEAARTRRGCSIRCRLLHRSGAGIWVHYEAVASFSPATKEFLGLMGSLTEVPDEPSSGFGSGPGGQAPSPAPPAPKTADRNRLADHLLLARAEAEREGDAAIVEALDLALYVARKRLARSTH